MILVRDVFFLHFGKTREALERFKELREILKKEGAPEPRMLTDVTGTYYTLVLEMAHESLAEYERTMGAFTPEWREWYGRFTPLVREGRREIFRVVE